MFVKHIIWEVTTVVVGSSLFHRDAILSWAANPGLHQSESGDYWEEVEEMLVWRGGKVRLPCCLAPHRLVVGRVSQQLPGPNPCTDKRVGNTEKGTLNI